MCELTDPDNSMTLTAVTEVIFRCHISLFAPRRSISYAWLQEFERSLASLTGLYAATLISSTPTSEEEQTHADIISSSVIQGGLKDSSVVDIVLADDLSIDDYDIPSTLIPQHPFLQQLVEKEPNLPEMVPFVEWLNANFTIHQISPFMRPTVGKLIQWTRRVVLAALLHHTSLVEVACSFSCLCSYHHHRSAVVGQSEQGKSGPSSSPASATSTSEWCDIKPTAPLLDVIVAAMNVSKMIIEGYHEKRLEAQNSVVEEPGRLSRSTGVDDSSRQGIGFLEPFTKICSAIQTKAKFLLLLVPVMSTPSNIDQSSPKCASVVSEIIAILRSRLCTIMDIVTIFRVNRTRALRRAQGLKYMARILSIERKSPSLLREALTFLAPSLQFSQEESRTWPCHYLQNLYAIGDQFKRIVEHYFWKLYEALADIISSSRSAYLVSMAIDAFCIHFHRRDFLRLQRLDFFETLEKRILSEDSAMFGSKFQKLQHLSRKLILFFALQAFPPQDHTSLQCDLDLTCLEKLDRLRRVYLNVVKSDLRAHRRVDENFSVESSASSVPQQRAVPKASHYCVDTLSEIRIDLCTVFLLSRHPSAAKLIAENE